MKRVPIKGETEELKMIKSKISSRSSTQDLSYEPPPRHSLTSESPHENGNESAPQIMNDSFPPTNSQYSPFFPHQNLPIMFPSYNSSIPFMSSFPFHQAPPPSSLTYTTDYSQALAAGVPVYRVFYPMPVPMPLYPFPDQTNHNSSAFLFSSSSSNFSSISNPNSPSARFKREIIDQPITTTATLYSEDEFDNFLDSIHNH